MLLSSTFKIKKTAIQNSGKNPVDILAESRSVVMANSFWDPVETVARQPPLSKEFSKQESWSG